MERLSGWVEIVIFKRNNRSGGDNNLMAFVE